MKYAGAADAMLNHRYGSSCQNQPAEFGSIGDTVADDMFGATTVTPSSSTADVLKGAANIDLPRAVRSVMRDIKRMRPDAAVSINKEWDGTYVLRANIYDKRRGDDDTVKSMVREVKYTYPSVNTSHPIWPREEPGVVVLRFK